MTQISSFLGLQTSLRGLLAQQRALDVTSHNISNAGTAGYTRQRAELTSFRTLDVASGAVSSGAGAHLGQGVEVEAYTRVRDAFLDLQWRAQQMTASERDATADGLSRVEEALSEPGDEGISALLQKFWDAWADVSNHPADQPTKQALVEAANTLTTAVQDLDRRLTAASTAAADEYSALTTSPQSPIFTVAQEIASLNPAIKLAQAAGRTPNDLLDRRDLLLDRLAEYGQLSVTDGDSDGAIDVAFGVPATALISGTIGAAAPPLPGNTGSGRLNALLGLQQKVADYRTEINGFVNGLVTAVNTAHGTPFFAAGGTTAATMSVVATAATVRTTATGGAGANDIASAIAGLRNGSVDRAYDAFVRHVGADAATAGQAKTTAGALLLSVEERRSGVSGVSLDEEMTSMIAFQRGYQASSRAMSTVDEMLDTLINRTGRVGL